MVTTTPYDPNHYRPPLDRTFPTQQPPLSHQHVNHNRGGAYPSTSSSGTRPSVATLEDRMELLYASLDSLKEEIRTTRSAQQQRDADLLDLESLKISDAPAPPPIFPIPDGYINKTHHQGPRPDIQRSADTFAIPPNNSTSRCPSRSATQLYLVVISGPPLSTDYHMME